ncbi:MAG: class I SAM-dependent methyltransferase [Acidobacteriota bacterium]|nr:class I SAM-dependent methyltransferase [Acidobacteriota bacterium]
MTTDDEIAESLDATMALLPHVPYLLQDLFAIGCRPDLILDIVRPIGLGSGHRVLDLACGKGAAGLTLAGRHGVVVRGVDAFEPFISEARARAGESGLTARCTFEVGDVREVTAQGDDADLVVYASVGVLGRHDRCVEALRRCVRGGGYIVIDDGFVSREADVGPGYDHYAGHEETRHRLTAPGATIVAETLADPVEAAAHNAAMTASIRARADELARDHPEHTDLFRGYVERQERECETLDRCFRPAVWLLRTGD